MTLPYFLILIIFLNNVMWICFVSGFSSELIELKLAKIRGYIVFNF